MWLSLAVLGLTPRGWIETLASVLSGLSIRFLPLRRDVLNQNLDIAFGPQPPEVRRDLLREIYRHSLAMIFECARFHRMTREELTESVQCDEAERRRLEAVVHAPSGSMMFTGHYGNWEIGAAWVAVTLDRTIGVIYKPMHNTLIDDLLLRQRGMFGLRLFSTHKRMQRDMIDWLRHGRPVGVLPDQDARRKGEFLPFFGQDASTVTGIARLAQRMNLPTAFCFCQRIAPGRFRLRTFFPEPVDPALDRDEAGRMFMASYHRALEEIIREDPAQYFWWHRRWKTRPPHRRPEGPVNSAHSTSGE